MSASLVMTGKKGALLAQLTRRERGSRLLIPPRGLRGCCYWLR
jgi:hypothetical protein